MSKDNINNSLSDLIKNKISLNKVPLEVALAKIEASLPKINLKLDLKQIEGNLSKFKGIVSNLNIDSNIKEIDHKDNNVIPPLSHIISYAFLVLSVREFSDSFKFLTETDNKFVEYSGILLKCGWTPANLPLSEINKVIEIYNSDLECKESLISEQILNFYNNSKIESILSQWNQKYIFQDRKHILKNIIDAHISGNYYLSVPVLLAQIEGILARGFYHKGQMREPCYTAYINEILSLNKNSYYDILITEFFVNSMMEDFEYGRSIVSKTSRHAIMHGADTKYGSIENSLKLILFFDYIQSKFNYFSLTSNNIFHIIGCNEVHSISREKTLIEPSNIHDYFIISGKKKHYYKKNMYFYNNKEIPIKRGLIPCTVCMKE